MQLSQILKLSLTVLLIVTWPSTCRPDDLPKPDFSCLSRPQKNAIEICFRENKQCHSDLQKQDESAQDDWQYFLGAAAVGVIGGILLSYELGIHK